MLIKYQNLLDALLNVIKTKYISDISIMIVYGSCVNGHYHEKSDLDILFIPKTEHGWSFAKTFILDGIGFDIWGTDWNRLEQFADFDDMMVSVLAESELVFYSSHEDKKRYEALKEKAINTTAFPLTHELIQKAENRLNTAKQHYGELCLNSELISVGNILEEVCNIVCLLNHTYLRFGSKCILKELSELERLPENLIETAKENCAILIKATERLLNEIKDEILNSEYDISGLYEEISSHWNKIRYSCVNGDVINTFLSAASLQDELNYVQKQFKVSIPELNFLNRFNPTKYDSFVTEANMAESAFVSLLESNNIKIKRYESIDGLMQSF